MLLFFVKFYFTDEVRGVIRLAFFFKHLIPPFQLFLSPTGCRFQWNSEKACTRKLIQCIEKAA
ncbi:hypothetical protein HMPREF3213_03629 [Heyndrickxia coagulans]|uniref:Uncharacterized protein n=1 Tax=Heyndrickxia coagulans TaxID=1398 RepID=A0A133KBF6_HEYCO|nr:hypothetical protein HMPREF3213_03629 [Heyndrickxia coagulans]